MKILFDFLWIFTLGVAILIGAYLVYMLLLLIGKIIASSVQGVAELISSVKPVRFKKRPAYGIKYQTRKERDRKWKTL